MQKAQCRLMFRTGILIVLLCGAAADGKARTAGASQGPRDVRTATATFAIRSIRAYLYYHTRGELDDRRGQFDDRDILTGRIGLRNIGIGGGDAPAPSRAVLILVDVEGPDSAKNVPGSVFLNVEAHSESIQIDGARLRLRDFVSESRLITLPIIIYGFFCSEVRIRASIEGTAHQHPVTARAPFTYGE